MLRTQITTDSDPLALACALPWAWSHGDARAGKHLLTMALSERKRFVLTCRALVHRLAGQAAAPEPDGPIATWVWLLLTASDRQAGIEFARRLWDTQELTVRADVLMVLVRAVADGFDAGRIALPEVELTGPGYPA